MGIEFREETELTEKRKALLKNCLEYIKKGNKATTSTIVKNISFEGYERSTVKRAIPELREVAEKEGLIKTEKVNTDSPIKAYKWVEVTDKGKRWLK